MLERLGVAGMSSDESDAEHRLAKVFRILIKPWRNPEVTLWLHTMDVINRGIRVMSSTTGNDPRARLVSIQSSKTGKPIRQLPLNAYRTEWYNALTEMEKEHISARLEPYSFAHSLAIRQCVTFLSRCFEF